MCDHFLPLYDWLLVPKARYHYVLKILTTHFKILTTHFEILTTHFKILTTHYGAGQYKLVELKKSLSKKQFWAEKDLFLIQFQQVLKMILIEFSKCRARKKFLTRK